MIHAEKSDWLIAKFIHSLINHLQGRDRGGLRVSKEEKQGGILGGGGAFLAPLVLPGGYSFRWRRIYSGW